MNQKFPQTRMRRLRQEAWIRNLVEETELLPKHLILPLFLIEGHQTKEPVGSMPGVDRLSIDLAVKKTQEAKDLGLSAVALFPKTDPSLKDEKGSQAINSENLVCRAVRAIKAAVPGIGVMCDVALDPYTTHGHDGILVGDRIDNDATLEVIAEQALVQAKAGCDILGPSEMMDGRVGVIRQKLEQSGFKDTLIMAYSAKYASAFYGPFRDAVGSKGLKGDKKTYQQNPANSSEALREVELDIAEGADMVMIKPAMPYLDVIQRVKQTFQVPTFAYQVSGEYSMLKAAIKEGWMDEQKVIAESLLSIRRAGADGILSYFALDYAKMSQK